MCGKQRLDLEHWESSEEQSQHAKKGSYWSDEGLWELCLELKNSFLQLSQAFKVMQFQRPAVYLLSHGELLWHLC